MKGSARSADEDEGPVVSWRGVNGQAYLAPPTVRRVELPHHHGIGVTLSSALSQAATTVTGSIQ